MEQNQQDIFSLTTGQRIDNLATVDNIFIRQLAYLAQEQAKQLKYISFVMRDKVNHRGEIMHKGIRPDMKSVIDLCKLTPLRNKDAHNLQDEIAMYRASKLGYSITDGWWSQNKEMLMVDYLLAASLCYVEVFDGSSKVDKFFATRNRFIAGMVAGVDANETANLVNYLATEPINYESRQLKALKLSTQKTGFKITRPRSAIDFYKNNVKITPLFLMIEFYNGLQEALQTQALKITYIKDNLTERDFITTLSPQILLTYYPDDFVQMMMANIETRLARGFVRLPELGISKYDSTGVRALNISRITKVELLPLEQFDSSYIDVNFNLILPNLKEALFDIKDKNVLSMIFEEMTNTPVPLEIKQSEYMLAELRNALISFIDSQFAIGTTTALRYFHKYMVARSQFFPKYNGGKPVQVSSIFDRTFNLGSASSTTETDNSFNPFS